MKMPSVEIEIEVYCNTCGAGLCNETDVAKTRNRGMDSFRVNACEGCLKSARDEGYDAGYEAARKEYENQA